MSTWQELQAAILPSETFFTRPLEKIHCDLWGLSPVVSAQGLRFYVILVDNYSRLTWFYPLKFKSDIYIRYFPDLKLW